MSIETAATVAIDVTFTLESLQLETSFVTYRNDQFRALKQLKEILNCPPFV